MTDVASSAHRRRSAGFGTGAVRKAKLGWGGRLAVAALPTLLCLAHLTFGANQPAAALWLTSALSLTLGVSLLTPWRRGLHDITPAGPLIGLFSLTLIAALLSMTPWAPGGPHPIWAWAGASPGATTVDPGATVLEVLKLGGLASVFVLGALQGVNRDRGLATLEAVVWTGGIYALIALVAFLTGAQVAQGGGRLSGGFLSFNSGATVFAILTVLGLSLFLRAWRKTSGQGVFRRLTAAGAPLASLSLTAVCLVLTASRMGLAATLLSVGVLIVWDMASHKKDRVVGIVAAAVLGLVGVVLVFGGNDLVWVRLSGSDVDADGRGQILAAHWQAFLASPLFGYGLGSFSPINMQIMTAENATALWPVRAAHNVYLQWLEEAGLIGALPMFALIAVVIGATLWRLPSARSGRTALQGLVCADLVVLAHGVTDYALQVPSIAALWAFLLGVQLAFGQARGG